MRVDLSCLLTDLPEKDFLSRETRRAARAAASILGLGKDWEISIALVGDEEICRLNRMYRGLDCPTDVLAFPMAEAADDTLMLGDVVVSIPTARHQAETRKVPLAQELGELVVHGILHLVGYTHDTDEDEEQMQQYSGRIMAQIAETQGT
ncbi:MAG: rRNA maturation RNase YbeY [Firmicutes bacterium]|nr:rRNA maturation RNase YbeY [Bacillota bacterium]